MCAYSDKPIPQQAAVKNTNAPEHLKIVSALHSSKESTVGISSLRCHWIIKLYKSGEQKRQKSTTLLV